MGSASSTPAPFSRSTTADQVAAAYPGAAAGRTFLVTGSAGGLGLETARVLAAAGAGEVIVSARSQEKCDATVAKLQAAVPAGRFSTLPMDLSDLKSVQAAADKLKASGKPVHVLINNAGIMACPYAETAQGFESQFGTNHLGHFAFTQALMPVLQRSAPSRVVNLSSVAHYYFTPEAGLPLDELARRSAGVSPAYEPWRNYGISKISNLLHANELQRRFSGAGVSAVSVHPGVIMETDLMRSVGLGTTLSMFGHKRAVFGGALTELPKKTPAGAATTVLAALAPMESTPAAAAAPFALRGGGYYADCALVPPGGKLHPILVNAETATSQASRLWELSERLVADGLR